MTLHRIIKWLTILMLALSLAIAGAWVWISRVRITPFNGGRTFFSTVLVYKKQNELFLLNELGNLRWRPEYVELGKFEFQIDLGQTENPFAKLEPVEYWNQFEIGDWHSSKSNDASVDPFNPDLDDRRLLARRYFVTWMTHEPNEGVEPEQYEQALSVTDRGVGKHIYIYWPGVAQRVRIHAPRALALTGFLTLAGFTALFIQRRKLRNRLRAGHCPNCNYDLRGINITTCPECGHTSPPPDILTD
ncbi:MAG: hypothetical protein H6812_12710 [Phycisphaeraceae bacterium]|nr:hypothetical protein [Phycisphaerales bacterium]MCB9844097.1 hypothetical protein [Phycisphaeraceae bacterium]